jgi:hypothetical protein
MHHLGCGGHGHPESQAEEYLEAVLFRGDFRGEAKSRHQTITEELKCRSRDEGVRSIVVSSTGSSAEDGTNAGEDQHGEKPNAGDYRRILTNDLESFGQIYDGEVVYESGEEGCADEVFVSSEQTFGTDALLTSFLQRPRAG